MANLTVVVDDAVLRRARIRAPEDGTSMNALVRDNLVGYVHDGGHAEAVRRFLDLSDDLDAGSGDGGRSWSREDLYAERAAWPR